MTLNRRNSLLLLAGKVVLGASLVLGFGVSPALADTDAPMEDSGTWSCVDDGNRICGPGNDEGKPAGCYNDGGVIVAPWPCAVVVNPDGSSDAYVGSPASDWWGITQNV